MDAAVLAVTEGMQQMPETLRQEYFIACATVAISAMHGTYGLDFAKEYLVDALLALDGSTGVVFEEPTKQ